MTITELVETAVIADLILNPELAALLPKPHDHDGKLAGDDEPGDDEATLTISVSATDRGELQRGTGIKKVAVQVEIRHNALATGSTRSQLDHIADLAGSRLQPSTAIEGVVGREKAFSSSALKVFGILEETPEPRETAEFIRVRDITRVFVCGQLT